MQWEQLSFFSPNHFAEPQPFDLRSNAQSEPFSEHVDSPLPHNRTQPIINIEQPGERQHVLERLLEKISQHHLPGTPYVEDYLRHKYRRNCKASTLRLTAESLMQFLSFFRTSGKRELEQMSREDFEAFVEDMQDRGLKPSRKWGRVLNCELFLPISAQGLPAAFWLAGLPQACFTRRHSGGFIRRFLAGIFR